MALNIVRTTKEIINKARKAETNNDLEKAAEYYEKAIKSSSDEEPYDRLMIIYRKLKRYKDELRVINAGIKSYENIFTKKSEKLLGKNKKLLELSRALAKTSGLSDKKGNTAFYPEPIGRWRKRKNVVENKI